MFDKPLLYPGDCSFYPNQQGYYLHNDFPFMVYGGGIHTVPAGFWFNGASIPAAFWQITFSPFDPRIISHALAHDWMYCSHIVTRRVADMTLYEGIKKTGATIRAKMVLSAVSSFGGMFWEDNENDRAYMESLRNKANST